MEGRYGPYVTDGETNASVPRTADPASLTLEAAVELLKARSDAGPSKRPRGGRPAARKSAPSRKRAKP